MWPERGKVGGWTTPSLHRSPRELLIKRCKLKVWRIAISLVSADANPDQQKLAAGERESWNRNASPTTHTFLLAMSVCEEGRENTRPSSTSFPRTNSGEVVSGTAVLFQIPAGIRPWTSLRSWISWMGGTGTAGFLGEAIALPSPKSWWWFGGLLFPHPRRGARAVHWRTTTPLRRELRSTYSSSDSDDEHESS